MQTEIEATWRPSRFSKIRGFRSRIAQCSLGTHIARDKIGSARETSCFQPTDVGLHLVDLVPVLQALHGERIALDADVALPNALVRLDRDEFDAVLLELIASAIADGALSIRIRMHMVGARVWVMMSDDGRETSAQAADGPAMDAVRRFQAEALSRAARFAGEMHGQLITRARPGERRSIALLLPTVLRIGLPDHGCGQDASSESEEIAA